MPVCECGVVPVVRQLYSKNLPVAVGITFLLAAPVMNPIVFVSTLTAFGWGPVLWASSGPKMHVELFDKAFVVLWWLALAVAAAVDAFHFSATRKPVR